LLQDRSSPMSLGPLADPRHPTEARDAVAGDPLVAARPGTGEAHARIERLPGLLDPMPLARHAEIVSGFATWLRAWEPRVRAERFDVNLNPPRGNERWRPT